MQGQLEMHFDLQLACQSCEEEHQLNLDHFEELLRETETTKPRSTLLQPP
jgi:hypothetical protein